MLVLVLSSLLLLALPTASQQTIDVILTSKDTQDRLSPKSPLSFGADFPSPITLSVQHAVKRQKIFGFGGAFTEAAAVNFMALSVENQNALLGAYWGPNGIGYTVGRIPINSCDFSVRTYSFDDTENDFALKNFDHNVTHDQAAMLPLIKRAMQTSHAPLRLYGSPWSPPAWMKVPHSPGIGMNGSASPVGLLDRPQVHTSWANYLSTWVSAYQAQGVPLWGMTVQNEPRALQSFESCLYTPESQRDFVRDYLGPILQRDHPSLQLMVWDHNKYNVTSSEAHLENMLSWAQVILGDSGAAQYVDGVAFHWYQIFENEGFNFDILEAVHAINPAKFLLNTEACVCPPATVEDWSHGELYGADIIGDLNSWSTGWVDWNVLLSAQGGPNHVNNFCEAPIMLSHDGDSLNFLAQYFYMGQISKFVLPDSVVVASSISGAFSSVTAEAGITIPALVAVAAERPDGQTVVVIQNASPTEQQVKLLDAPNRAAPVTIPARSIITLVYSTSP